MTEFASERQSASYIAICNPTGHEFGSLGLCKILNYNVVNVLYNNMFMIRRTGRRPVSGPVRLAVNVTEKWSSVYKAPLHRLELTFGLKFRLNASKRRNTLLLHKNKAISGLQHLKNSNLHLFCPFSCPPSWLSPVRRRTA